MSAPQNARSRVRAQLTEEIKDAARAELGVAGSAGLSLRAVARRLGMVPSALYRYFDGRDALLTALILDAYRDLGSAVEEAEGAAGRSPLRRWLAVGHALRDWAIAHPHEWGLIHGAPVPGYEAPEDTVEAALAPVALLAGLLRPLHAPGSRPPTLPVSPAVGRDLHHWIASIRDPWLSGLPDPVIALAATAYSSMVGAVSFELFGQFGVDATPAPAIFDHGLRVHAALVGLPGAP